MNPASSLYKEISKEAIRELVQIHFGTSRIREITLLKGGMFNTTYKVVFGEEDIKTVLRLGPVNRHLLMGFEADLMQAEQHVYQLCEKERIPCPHILACDTTKQVIDRDYMFVAYLDSKVLLDCEKTEAQKGALYEEVGTYMARFHQITGSRFGRVSKLCKGEGEQTWADCLIGEVTDILAKAEAFQAFNQVEADTIRRVFETYRSLFDEVKTPHLVHCDLWEGNVLIAKRGEADHVAAIIDADRAMFGDVDFEFASPWMTNEHFMRGYRLDPGAFQDPKRVLRRKLYLLDYYLAEVYVGIAEYHNLGQYLHHKGEVLKLIHELL